MKKLIVSFLATMVAGQGSVASQSNAGQWYKGQLHVHTSNSFDSSDPPATVVSRYKSAGYDFIAISDHNFVTHAQQYDTSTFLTLPNNELSLGSGNPVVPGTVTGPIHVNAINISGAQPPGSPTTLQGVIDLAVNAGALAQINHPVRSGISASAIIASQGATLLEVIQTHDIPVNTALWDTVLSGGKQIYATGTDDAHNSGNTNRCWVVVRANSLTVADIVTALRNGDFYASNGPSISSISKANRTLSVNSDGSTVTFIGRNGTVLHTVNSGSASYTLPLGGLYLRAVVTNGSGQVAYTQAYFPGSPLDTAAPSIPGNPTASVISSSQIDLSWNASTDNVGVAGYRVYQGGTQIATTSQTSYPHTGLAPSTTYSYGVAAYDAAGNASVQSASASATTHPASSDSDADSLADSWEIQYFGNLTQDGSGDFDADGATNLAEYQAGTDPTQVPSTGSYGGNDSGCGATGVEMLLPFLILGPVWCWRRRVKP